ncbi:hypothetical protein GCM10023322_39190 [Rugosimonospora acidiphila]|uniref:Helix-turn-helix domain-containing protein n=1 Tax=Rugosimonospora acidiphila TaxID=556531 RepID=A0ABP9RWJ9_9ACTN
MSTYTITLTPEDSADASAIVRVEIGPAGPRITELTVRAGTGGELVPGRLPGVDLGRLLRALTPPAPPVARRPGTAKSRAVKSRAVKSRAVKSRAVKSPAAVPAVAGDGRRAYRRAPGDLAEVYARTPDTAALADHYGVPRHTAQGWLRRLRADGGRVAPRG